MDIGGEIYIHWTPYLIPLSLSLSVAGADSKSRAHQAFNLNAKVMHKFGQIQSFGMG